MFPPRINDISSDLDDPPAFGGPAPRRSYDPDLPERFKAAIRKTYPLEPARLKGSAADAYDRSIALARDNGWVILHEDRDAGTFDALATTPLLRFKDDIVVRVRADGDDAVVDMRSRSRLGTGDFGVNARRIAAFLSQLQG